LKIAFYTSQGSAANVL